VFLGVKNAQAKAECNDKSGIAQLESGSVEICDNNKNAYRIYVQEAFSIAEKMHSSGRLKESAMQLLEALRMGKKVDILPSRWANDNYEEVFSKAVSLFLKEVRAGLDRGEKLSNYPIADIEVMIFVIKGGIPSWLKDAMIASGIEDNPC